MEILTVNIDLHFYVVL